jgi:stage III sporulation protein AG
MGEREPGINPGVIDALKNLTKKPMSLWLLLGLLVAGILLIISSNSETSKISGTPVASQSSLNMGQSETDSVETQLEKELTATLSSIAGVGKVQVIVNLKSKRRMIWERQAQINKRTSQQEGTIEEDSNDQLVFAKDASGGDQPVLKEELAPEIQGVIVIATGAADVTIRQLLTTTVVTVLDIPPHRVIVLPGEYKGGTSE